MALDLDREAPVIDMETNLAQVFRGRAALYGDRVRWREKRNGQALRATWRENKQIVNSLIAGLDALGAAPGDVVGILSNTRWEWTAADWTIIGLGAACVTLYPSNTPDTIAYILNDSGTRYVFAENAAQYAKLLGIREQIPAVRRVILFDDAEQFAADDWAIGFDTLQLLSPCTPEEADAFASRRAADICREDLLTLVYTSGTTGTPKGVPLPHGTFMGEIIGVRQMLDTIQPGMVDLLFLPLSHVFGREQHICAYDLGLETVIAGNLDTLAADIRATHPDLLFSVPRIYEKAYDSILARIEKGSR
ncbi:MAG TPA: AMP-binding protein, partial [Ktedonobacterales bacterium]|nr:AMP-binding protein [Ktedonobacterales bacterium]